MADAPVQPAAVDASEALAGEPFPIPAGQEVRALKVVPVARLERADLLRLALQAAWPQQHPVRLALTEAWREQRLGEPPPPTGNWHVSPARGLQGYLNGYHVLIGNEQLMRDGGIAIPPPAAAGHERPAVEVWRLFVAARASATDRNGAHSSLLGYLVLAPAAQAPRPDTSAGPPEHERMPRLGQRMKFRTPAWFRHVPWRVAGPLAVLSAIAGLGGSMLRVPADEVAVVRRLGRTVAVCPPGTYVRWLWPVERVTRVQPRARRQLRLMLGAEAGPDGSNPAPFRRHVIRPEGVLTGVSRSLESAAAELAQPRLGLLRMDAEVNYSIGDPEAYLRSGVAPDEWMATCAEATLRELIAAVPLDPIRPQVAEYAGAWEKILKQRVQRARCGLTLDLVRLGEVTLAAEGSAEAAWNPLRSAYDETQEILLAAQQEAARVTMDARAKAERQLADALQVKTADIEFAHAEARRLDNCMRASGGSPAEARLLLIRELLAERLPGRRSMIVDPELGSGCRIALERGDESLLPPLWVTVGPSGRAPEGLRP